MYMNSKSTINGCGRPNNRAARNYNIMSHSEVDDSQEEKVEQKPAAWEEQQMETFTRWINMHLKKRGFRIEHILNDLSNGQMLRELLEILSNKTLPKLEKGSLRLHMVNNINRCIEFVKANRVKLENIGSEEIVDHNRKVILGFIWSIILRFAIEAHDELKVNDGLLIWVKNRTKPYRNVNVTNFSTSFSDGLAFNALIHAHRPELLDFNALDKKNEIQNLNQAFNIAEKHLGIPPFLDACNMADPDKLSVMTYVAAFYDVFSKNQVVDRAANRINRALDSHGEIGDLTKEYEKISSDLYRWIKKNSDEFSQFDPDNLNIDELVNKINDIGQFRNEEKPPRSQERATLDKLANNIRTKRKLANLPPYNPIHGHSVPEINNAWRTMNEYERSLLERLHFNLRNALLIDNYLKRFYAKCDQQDAWVSGKLEPLTADVSSVTFLQLTGLKNNLIEQSNELESRDSKVRVITSLRNKLAELKCKEMPKIDERHDAVKRTMENIKAAFNDYSKRLAERERILTEIDQRKKQYSQLAYEIRTFLEDCIEDLNDTFLVNSLPETEALLKEMDTYKTAIEDKESKLNVLSQLGNEISSSSDPHNYYCSISVDDLNNKFNAAKLAQKDRSELLTKEIGNQTKMDSLKLEFAKIAEEINNFRLSSIKELTSLASLQINLEEQAQRIKQIAEKINAFYKARIPTLDQLNKTMQENKIYHNERSVHSMESINSEYQELFELTVATLNEVETQIIMRDSGKISESQLKEYKKTFDIFDKSRLNFLTYENFRNFLVSLEFPVGENNPAGENEFKRILSIVDPDNATKQITFQKFLEFISAENVEVDNAEQIMKAFKQLTNDKDYIMPEVLRAKFPKRADSMMAMMIPSTASGAPPGALDFRPFVASFFGQSDL